jgi:hypothetical protein
LPLEPNEYVVAGRQSGRSSPYRRFRAISGRGEKFLRQTTRTSCTLS